MNPLNSLKNNSLPDKRLVLLFILSILLNLSVFAQKKKNVDDDHPYRDAQARLTEILKKRAIDPEFSDAIDRFYGKSCDSLIKTKTKTDGQKPKQLLTRLFQVTALKLENGSLNILRVPSVNNYFLQTLKTYKKGSLAALYRQIGLTQSGMLAFTFELTGAGDSIKNITGVREMLSAPYYISTRIGKPEYTNYRDTLLYFLANEDPATFTKKLEGHDSLFTALVSKSTNMTVNAVAKIPKDVYYEKTLPFGIAIAQNRMTAEEVKKLTMQPEAYYTAFVDEVIRLHLDKNNEIRSYLNKPIAKLNADIANKFYIGEVNDLHESPDAVRFKILQNRTPRELYFMLVDGTGELYTSSFLYIYKKFIKDTEKDGVDKFFADIDYYRFDAFVANIAGYGLVDDLVGHLKEETVAKQLGNAIARLSSSQLGDDELIVQAMTMSDELYAIRNRASLKETLAKQIDDLKRPRVANRVANDILLQRLYTGLKGILQDKTEYISGGTYNVLKVAPMKKNNIIVQACFFYDDDDGTYSFNNSTATYAPANWDKKDLGNYILFTSKSGNNMRVYMNRPNTKAGCDTAQDQMLRDMRADGYEPTTYIHRGHSYYLAQSLRKMTSSAQFVFFGSCGGYNEVLQMFRLNPDVQIIATRNIGSSQINDPMLQQINNDIVNNKDIVWNEEWKNFDAKFQSKTTKDLFSSYIAPNKYIGIMFIRKVFNY